MDSTVSILANVVGATSDWVRSVFEFQFARAVIFEVNIGGHLFVEGLLLVVILFLLSQKSYKPPKRPLTKKEIVELCEEWAPEPLIPSITDEMKREPPVLESGISLFGAQLAEKVMYELNRSITVHKDERGESIVHSTSFCGLD